ncbi:MAG: hypothetical protein HQK55_11325, partial [Deltaproteobacteria bacterium]|nr:hypothetical protein [Deltaproteobacteria bacterium]
PLTEAPEPVITSPEPETTTSEAEISVPEPVKVPESMVEALKPKKALREPDTVTLEVAVSHLEAMVVPKPEEIEGLSGSEAEVSTPTQPIPAGLKSEMDIPADQPPVKQTDMTPHEAFALAVEELKNLIRAEFSALRAEIRMWRQGQ